MHSPLIVRRRSLAVLFGLCLAASAAPSAADVWDNDPSNEDDSNNTDNELFHGDVQVHDLAAQAAVPDQDWFAIRSRPFSSYEVLTSGLQGEIWGSTNASVDRVDGTGAVLTAGDTPPSGQNSSKSVRWANNSGTQSIDYIRVDGNTADCNITCSTNSQYTIRMWETTGAISRFNNSGSQSTVLILQNPTDYVIAGTVYFWDPSGTQVATLPFILPPKGLSVTTTSTLIPGVAGSITITQNGRFGDLQGKSVALEPATGFSFDTPLEYRPH
jgi:hypothetical protein